MRPAGFGGHDGPTDRVIPSIAGHGERFVRRAVGRLLDLSLWSFGAAILTAGCGGSDAGDLKGLVRVDGSSTVAPLMMGAAELFQEVQPDVGVVVGISGTGGGFKKFLAERADLRIDVINASRPIRPIEIELAAKLGVEFIELPIAYDGIAVVANPANHFCDELTVEELRRVWEPGSTVTTWADIREGFPELPLKLYGPGTDSGTFDYFTGAIVGKEKACRNDFTASENDNVLVQGVSGDRGALGYFGFAYFQENRQALKLLGISEKGHPPVKPTAEAIRSGAYSPLSRPLFVYVNREAAERTEVRLFMEFALEQGVDIAQHPRVGLVALPTEVYEAATARLHAKSTGSFMAVHQGGPIDLMKVLAAKREPGI